MEMIELKNQHFFEKQSLRGMETFVDYRINNQELTLQRDKVRRLKDKIIMAEAYDEYPYLSKTKCGFRISEGCKVNINHSFYHWMIYGNCCQECSRVISNSSTKFVDDDTVYYPKYTAWDELSTLDSQDIDIYLE